jgi:sugar O-acyltransferase (sialic acid O-acetyltransferase NeuD family)
MHKKSELIIFGVKNMALEIREIVLNFYADTFSKTSCIYFSDSFIQDNNLEEKINRLDYTIFFIIGFGGSNRTDCIEALKKYSNFKPFTVIHPSAVIAPSAKIGEGCFIQPNATISTNVQLGDHCLVNYNVSVGHDSVLADNVFIQPGARVSGNCKIGANTLIGSNSFVYQNVKVGEGCLIDALTYIHDDVPNKMVVSSRYSGPISRDSLKNKLPI